MNPSAPTIPDELIQQLHDATERFQRARQELEHSMAGSDYRHQQRIDQAGDRLREAERDLERIDSAIKNTWH
jgi:chromosome segregation ATPase